MSTSIRALIPELSKRYEVFFVSPRAEGGVPSRSLFDLYRLLRHWPQDRHPPVWHVRRNNEMTWGLLFRTFVNRRLKLVFTNSAIRRHSAWPRWLISQMDMTIVTAQAGLQYLPKSFSIVPHGVDIARYSEEQEDYRPAWSEYKIVVGIVGRIRPEKGTDLFVRAISQVLPKYGDVSAVLVGKATAKYKLFFEDLKKQCQQAGIADRVFFLDEVPSEDMPVVYQCMDVVCAPALYEGYGLVPLEAMVSGTAVIASRTGAYEDFVIPSLNGELVDCGSLEQLSKALEDMLADPVSLKKYQQQGASLVRERFSISREVEGVSNAYEALFSVINE